MKFQDKIVWITGASSGIGEALAYAFSKEGASVVLSARRKEALARVAANCPGPSYVFPLDLTLPAQIKETAEAVLKEVGPIDILVNNGGMSMRALTQDTSVEVDRKIMEVNYFGHIILTKAVLPSMLDRKQGHIAAISSITGKFGFPLRSAYSAAKHALHGFFETLGLELNGKGIDVSLINPGRINTEISLHALNGQGKAHGQMDQGQAAGMPAEVCAEKILQAIYKQKKEANIGGKEILMVYFKRYLPSLFRRIATRVSPT